MLRIFFTAEDLARTRVAREPDAMWELALSLHLLSKRDGAAVFGAWRRHTRAQLRPEMKPFADVNPPVGNFPDFLTPYASGMDTGAGLDTLLHTPRTQLRADLAILGAGRPLTPWMRDLADGRSGAIGTLATAIGAYEQMALAPHWPVIAAAVEADRARRAMAVLDGGCEGLLASLRPAMRWNSPVLEADFPFDQELHLDGRGLLLVPSYFCWEVPITLVDPGRPPVLVYPIDHPGGMLGAAAAGAGALAALIGRTRASVLASIGAGCTTTELSRRTGVSAASASQHATVLRAAGLVDTRRDRNAVLHSLTPSGTALLAQAG